MDWSGLFELGTVGIMAVALCIIGMVLWNFSKQLKVIANGGSSNCGQPSVPSNESVARAHFRLDEHSKEHMVFMQNCSTQHNKISEFMGKIGADVETLTKTLPDIQADIRAIRNGGQKGGAT